MREDRGSQMTKRLVSLAAGTVLDVDPAQTVEVAAAAGFGAVGLWFDPATWTQAMSTSVARRLRADAIIPLDIEPVILGRGQDPGDAVVDTAAELGVRHALVASGPADRGAVVQRFGELCERAAPAGVVVVLEFLPIFTIAALADAVGVVDEVGSPNGAVLVDTLHLARSGGSPDDLRELRPGLVPYLQIADAPAEPPGRDRDTLRAEALHGRMLPGEGALPLAATLAAVPEVPLSLELRSAALLAAHPDAKDRARAVFTATERLLSGRPGQLPSR
jgi:sugar phosphate isomerase/epimerase